MTKRNLIAVICALALLVIGLNAVSYAYQNNMKTYDGSDVNVVELYNNPDSYDVSGAQGIADIIVKENLQKTEAANNVAAVVFDFRGFDTLGESFILITAIAGSFVILGKRKKEKKEESES